MSRAGGARGGAGLSAETADEAVGTVGGTMEVPASAPSPRASRSLLRGGSFNLIAQVFPLAINLLLTPYVIHGLGIERFGLYVVLLTVSDFLRSFDGGIYASANRYFAVYAGRDDRAATTRLLTTLVLVVSGLGVLVAAVLAFTAPYVLKLFSFPAELQGEATFLLRTFGLVVALALLRGLFSAVLTSRQRFGVNSAVTVGQYVVYSAGLVLTVESGSGLRGVALTFLAQMLISGAVLALAARPWLDRRAVRPVNAAETRDFFRYASRAQVVGVSDLINLQADAFITGAFLDVRRVALYSAGANLSHQVRNLPTNAVAPAAALLGAVFGERGEEAAITEFRRLQRLWVVAVTGWVVVAAGIAGFGIPVWLGPTFRISGLVAVVLMVAHLLRLWVQMLVVLCQTVGRPELEARYAAVAVGANLVLTVALVGPLGVIGVVLGTALGQGIGTAVLVREVRRRYRPDIPTFLGEVPWVATAVTAAAVVGLELLVRPVVPRGALGLVVCGLAALPAGAIYGVLALGPSASLAALRLAAGRLVGRIRTSG